MKYVMAGWLVVQEILGVCLGWMLKIVLVVGVVIVIPFLLIARAQIYLDSLESYNEITVRLAVAGAIVIYMCVVAGVKPLYIYLKGRYTYYLEQIDPRKQKESE